MGLLTAAGSLLLVVFVVLLLACADHRGKDADTPLALDNLAAKLVPRVQTCNAGGVWPLPCNLEDVPEAVVMESPHGGEVGRQGPPL